MLGDRGVSKTRLGLADVDADPEKREERRGRTKRKRRGSRLAKAEETFCWPSEPGGTAVPGRLRGRPPPNWWTRTPGPPPRLKTKAGPVSMPPVVC